MLYRKQSSVLGIGELIFSPALIWSDYPENFQKPSEAQYSRNRIFLNANSIRQHQQSKSKKNYHSPYLSDVIPIIMQLKFTLEFPGVRGKKRNTSGSVTLLIQSWEASIAPGDNSYTLLLIYSMCPFFKDH